MEGGSQLYRQGWQSSQESREQNLRHSRKAAAGSRYKAGNKHKTHCSSFSAQDIFEIFSNLKKNPCFCLGHLSSRKRGHSTSLSLSRTNPEPAIPAGISWDLHQAPGRNLCQQHQSFSHSPPSAPLQTPPALHQGQASSGKWERKKKRID